MSASLTVPNSNITLIEGSVVILQRFPGTKWVVHNGWYTYAGTQYMGWYFSSIPAQTIIPMNEQDLAGLTIVSSNDYRCPDLPYPPIPGPFPPAPGPFPPLPVGDLPAYVSNDEKARYEAAFISLPLIDDRDALNTDKLPDGKIVRVNNVNGEPRYYVWSQYNGVWEDVEFPSPVTPTPQPQPATEILIVTAEEVDEQIILSSSYADIIAALDEDKVPVIVHNRNIYQCQGFSNDNGLQFTKISCSLTEPATVAITFIEVNEDDTIESGMIELATQE